MKKCPFCKAEIEDNARFCLYCMKPLNEKEVIPPPQQRKKPWWLVIAAVLAAVLMLIPRGENNAPGESAVETDAPTESIAPTIEKTQPITNPGVTQKPTEYTESPTIATQPETQPPTAAPTVAPTTPTTVPTVATTAPTAPKTEVVFTYRAARAGDDFNANYQNTGNDIVITGVAKSAADGVYDIPSYIDGKKVIAIVANAFSGSNAKVVYIPTTVKTIWNYAFSGCDLTDIYFRGNAIYMESKAFSGNVTIHCSASCSDRNFRYYKNSSVNYGATWEEWNG